MSKTVLFQTIQFCISTQFISIKPRDRTLSGANALGKSGSESNGSVFCIPQSSSITEASPSNYLVSYPGHTSRCLIPPQRCSRCILQPQLNGKRSFRVKQRIVQLLRPIKKLTGKSALNAKGANLLILENTPDIWLKSLSTSFKLLRATKIL